MIFLFRTDCNLTLFCIAAAVFCSILDTSVSNYWWSISQTDHDGFVTSRQKTSFHKIEENYREREGERSTAERERGGGGRERGGGEREREWGREREGGERERESERERE